MDYTALATTANILLADFGRSVKLVKMNRTAGTPSQPWLGPTDPRANVVAQLTLIAVFVEPSSLEQLGISTKDSDLVKRSTKIMIIAPGSALTHDLATFDEVEDGAMRWRITAIETLKPGATTLLYFIGVAR